MNRNPYEAPATSVLRVSKTRPVRFEFPVGEHHLVAEGDMGSGRERIFLDGEKVVEKRTFARKSRHHIRIDGIDYDVLFYVRNPLVSVIRCSLLRDGVELRRQRCTAKVDGVILTVWILLSAVVFALFQYLDARFSWPDTVGHVFTGFVFIMFMVAGHFATVRGEKEVVDELVEDGK